MKKIIVSIMFVTGSSLILLSVFVLIFGQNFIYIRTIFETLAANTLIILGLHLTRKFESRYIIFEYLLDIGYVILVLVVLGSIFNWLPVWVLLIMAVVIYAFGLLIDLVRTREEAEDMDKLLQKRKEKHTDNAS